MNRFGILDASRCRNERSPGQYFWLIFVVGNLSGAFLFSLQSVGSCVSSIGCLTAIDV